MTVLARTVDPDGRAVELTAERWDHITHADNHPQLAAHLEAVLLTVSQPTRQLPGRELDEVWFVREGVGPSRWLQVVVVFSSDRAFIVTAFPRRRVP